MTDYTFAEPGDPDRLVDGVMRLPRKVYDRTRHIGRFDSAAVTCRHNRDHIRQAAARCKITGSLSRISDEVVHPANQHVLHPYRTGACVKHARIPVEYIRQIIAEG